MKLIGREKEITTLHKLNKSERSEFIAIYGRRRVGKTLLIKETLKEKIIFHATGMANVTLKTQLLNFYTALQKQYKGDLGDKPKNWFEAFQLLITYSEKSSSKRKIIFLDELPWFDTQKSDFIQSLEHFWNSWAAQRDDIMLIVCGSAASWMINKLINHKGGLHNRITARIKLEPFTLYESEKYLQSRNIHLERYQIIELYMAMGGIPYYLEQVQKGLSATQNIENICFSSNGILRNEFDNLYLALFSKAERHISIVRAMAKKSKGLTRSEIIKYAQVSNSGTTTKILEELELSGFIRRYNPFGKKKKNSLYQLIDGYTLFYLKFIESTNPYDKDLWVNTIDSPSRRAWSGYAYEQVCFYHIHQIKKTLGITGVHTQTYSWKSTDSSPGAQIDLIIDRRDHSINLCEIKFSIAQYTITTTYAKQITNKIEAFRSETGTKKALLPIMISTYGVKPNKQSIGLIQNEVIMDDLFEP